MRLRQFVFVAERLAPAVEDLSAVLGLEVCYRDPGVAKFGLENALLPIGGDFLEVVAPTRDGTAAGRHLARLGGDGGYMILVQCADGGAARARITALGMRVVWRHDADDAVATHFHPSDVPGAILSVDSMTPGDDWRAERADWKWAGPGWRDHVRTDRVAALTAVELRGDDPEAMAEIWARVLDLPVTDGPAIALDNATLRFASGEGPGIAAIDLRCADRDAVLAAVRARGLECGETHVTLCGVRVNLV